MPLLSSLATWSRLGRSADVSVVRLPDTKANRQSLRAKAALDGVPSAIAVFGSDVALLSGAGLVTRSALARAAGPALGKGDAVSVAGETGKTVFTDDGFDEIDASGVIVAVIDTGVDPRHPALKGALLPGYNAMTGTSDVEDHEGHGTHVAGIIAAAWSKHREPGGVAPRARVLPIKAGDSETMKTADVARGIDYAVAHGAKIINLSLAAGKPTPDLQAAIRRAQTAGVLVLCAVGNRGTRRIDWPAAYPETLAVGSSTGDRRSGFSNFGDRLDLLAPGDGITSTVPGGGYGKKNGTSMATPYVAAAAALAIARHPDWDLARLRAHLLASVRDLGAQGRDAEYGEGDLDLFQVAFGEQ